MAEYCDIAENECVNPPGYGVGMGGFARNADPPRTRFECPVCGKVACKKCRKVVNGQEMCLYCADDAENSRRGE